MNKTREVAEQITADLGYHGGWQAQQALTEAIDAALRQREAEVRAEEWMPIETAPRDKGHYKLVARFENSKLLWWEKAKPSGAADWKTPGGYVVPTHWREVQ